MVDDCRTATIADMATLLKSKPALLV